MEYRTIPLEGAYDSRYNGDLNSMNIVKFLILQRVKKFFNDTHHAHSSQTIVAVSSSVVGAYYVSKTAL